jgi:hypothetical protein
MQIHFEGLKADAANTMADDLRRVLTSDATGFDVTTQKVDGKTMGPGEIVNIALAFSITSAVLAALEKSEHAYDAVSRAWRGLTALVKKIVNFVRSKRVRITLAPPGGTPVPIPVDGPQTEPRIQGAFEDHFRTFLDRPKE